MYYCIGSYIYVPHIYNLNCLVLNNKTPLLCFFFFEIHNLQKQKWQTTFKMCKNGDCKVFNRESYHLLPTRLIYDLIIYI